MAGLLLLPLDFLKFWFLEAPLSMLSFFASLDKAFFELFSLPLLIKTYFKPWKNEYRKGLVGFSRAMGMFIKSFVIIADLILFTLLLIVEVFAFAVFIVWPFVTIYILFI